MNCFHCKETDTDEGSQGEESRPCDVVYIPGCVAKQRPDPQADDNGLARMVRANDGQSTASDERITLHVLEILCMNCAEEDTGAQEYGKPAGIVQDRAISP